MDSDKTQPVGGAGYDTQPPGLEKWLDETFHLKAPFQFPVGLSSWLANNSWWLALVGAVLSVLGVLSTYNSINYFNETTQMLGAYGATGATGALLGQSVNLLYVSMASSAIAAVLLFLASSKLKAHQKAGWNLVYYNFLINAALSLVGSALFATATIVFSLIGFVIGFAIGAYILFQIRGYFTK